MGKSIAGLPNARQAVISAALVTLLAVAAPAADWPRFRGPNGAGVADTTGLPLEFGAAKNLLWKTPLPAGHSSPIISGDRIYLTALQDGKLYTLCLDRRKGRILWRRESPRPRSEAVDKRNSSASPTPVADGGNIYVFFPDYGLLSYRYDGKERWRTPLGPFQNYYGMGASPIVAGNRIVLVCDQSRDSFIIAFGKDDGKVRWKTARPEALSGHSTPIVYQPPEGPLQIIAPGSFRMDAYSVETGEDVWWVHGLASEMKSTPVLDGETVYINGFNTPENDPGRQVSIPPFDEVVGKFDANKDGRISLAEIPDQRTKTLFPFVDLDRDGTLDASEWRVYIAMMAAENGLLAIHAGGHGETSATSLRWKFQRSIPQLPSTVLYKGVLYMISDAGVLTTLDGASGKLLKQARLRGVSDQYFASPVAADDKVFIASRSGVVSVLKAGGDQEVLAANSLDDEIYATPAIADGRIYIRTRGALYCFGGNQPHKR